MQIYDNWFMLILIMQNHADKNHPSNARRRARLRSLAELSAVVLCVSFVAKAQTPAAKDVIPLLSAAEMAQQTIKCKPQKIDAGILPKGTIVPARVTVDEAGKIVGLTFADTCPVGCGRLADAILSVKSCKFRPYIVDGKAIVYKGDVDLVAR